MDEVEIIDGSIPPNWIYTKSNKNSCCDCLFPNGFGDQNGDFFEELDGGWISVEQTLIANEMLEFHNMPLIEIPKEYMPLPTVEEQRQKAINDELEEYLRLAEENEKNS